MTIGAKAMGSTEMGGRGPAGKGQGDHCVPHGAETPRAIGVKNGFANNGLAELPVPRNSTLTMPFWARQLAHLSLLRLHPALDRRAARRTQADDLAVCRSIVLAGKPVSVFPHNAPADAVFRAVRSEIASFAVTVGAKDEAARRFYERENFEPLS